MGGLCRDGHICAYSILIVRALISESHTEMNGHMIGITVVCISCVFVRCTKIEGVAHELLLRLLFVLQARLLQDPSLAKRVKTMAMKDNWFLVLYLKTFL